MRGLLQEIHNTKIRRFGTPDWIDQVVSVRVEADTSAGDGSSRLILFAATTLEAHGLLHRVSAVW